MIDIKDITVKKARKMLDSKEVSSVELTKAYLDTITKEDARLKAYITVSSDVALECAKRFDEGIPSPTPLAGIPMILKDNIITKGVRTTAASKILEEYTPQYHATVYTKLLQSPLLGKGNMDVFAFGGSTENSGFFPTRNPWDTTRVPGGSSGGPAAAVAANLALFGIGTDTGGSIRQPASFCGIVGVKPTYGRCSRYGLIAMGSSFDCPGPLTKTVEDAAIILDQIAGKDEKDGTTIETDPVVFSDFSHVEQDVKGKKIGIPTTLLQEGLDPRIKESIEQATKVLTTLGCELVDVDVAHIRYALPIYYLLVSSEISTNMARFDGIRYGTSIANAHDEIVDVYMKNRSLMEPELKRRIMLGTYALSSGYYDAYYKKASQVRKLLIDEFKELFTKVDVVLTPTSPVLPFPLGEKSNDPLEMYLIDIYTTIANIVGIPGISVPCGLVDGLPVGMQLMGNFFREKDILDIAYLYESAILSSSHAASFTSAFLPA